jgi:PAS domain S-box-containing protein
VEAKDESNELRATVLQTAKSLVQVRQRAEEDMRRANEVLERRTKELAKTLAIMRATLESTEEAILVTDERGQVITFNENYAAIWQIPPEVMERGKAAELHEHASRNLVTPHEFLARLEKIHKSEEETVDSLEVKDNRTIELHSKVLLIEGTAAGRVWSFRDVTERNAAELTSRRLAAIVASSDDAIIGKDLSSIITSWNTGAERIFGYTAEEMIGTSVMRLIPAERQAEEIDILSRIRRSERVDHFETVRVTKDGRRLNLSITVSPIKDSTGKVVGASKVARDITDQKNAQAALQKAMEDAEKINQERLQLLDSERDARSQAERASRMKDEFLATLSHELRTPLNAVLGWANILQMNVSDAEELKQAHEAIARNARSQAQIIDDLLDMSRIISGKVRLDVQRVDLPAVLNASIDTVRAGADAKGVHLETRMAPVEGLRISGDPNRLQQVFWNLLNNAIKFTPTGGRVQVRLERTGSQLEIRVADSGEGIAPEFLPYVFDRFQQADASTTRRHGGLGLGLAIVKQLIELHGGSVEARSDGAGRGAVFILRLPLNATYSDCEEEPRRPDAARREAASLPEISLSHIHALVVDDEPDARQVVKRILEMAGARVTAAGSAAEAMSRILEDRPDVLVCDIGMPGEDGYALIQRIRAMEGDGERSLPAVALTAYVRTEDRTKAIRYGFQNHLGKPIETAELLAVVSSLGGGQRAARE